MKNSIKREQSQACLNFAERKNFRLQAKHKILSLLVLLLTAASGAWADETPLVTITFDSDGPVYSVEGLVTLTGTDYNTGSAGVYYWSPNSPTITLSATVEAVADNVSISKVVFWGLDTDYAYPLEDTEKPFVCYANYDHGGRSLSETDWTNIESSERIAKVEVFGTAEPDIEVNPVAEPAANTKQWTFTMPASDVLLTPIYAAATIYESNGETEKQAYATLQEAFDNVQDGDIIVLEDTVTLTEMIQTPTITGGVKFILDFNGYPIYSNYYFKLNNAGDELTFKDTSDDQKGGMNDGAFFAVAGAKFIFDGGRYKCGNNTAQQMKNLCDITPGIELAEGKEFVDIENGPDEKGFMVRVVYKASDLTIDPGKFATFYLDQNVKLADGTSTDVKLYTIIGVNEDRTTAYLTELTGVVEKETPMLVYNSGNAKQAVTIEPTNEQPDAENHGISPIEQFMGTSTAKTFSNADMEAADYYALSGGKAFAKVRGGGTLKARQCWLEFTKPQGGNSPTDSRSIMLVFDSQTTGITTTDYTDSTDDTIYDLSGRKLNKQPKLKGVYIQRGNKTVIR